MGIFDKAKGAVSSVVPDRLERAAGFGKNVPPPPRRPAYAPRGDVAIFRVPGSKKGASSIPSVADSQRLTPEQRKTFMDIWYKGGFHGSGLPGSKYVPRLRVQNLPGLYGYASAVRTQGGGEVPYIVLNSALMPKNLRSKEGADFVLTALHEIAHTRQKPGIGAKGSYGAETRSEGAAEVFSRAAGLGRPLGTQSGVPTRAEYSRSVAARMGIPYQAAIRSDSAYRDLAAQAVFDPRWWKAGQFQGQSPVNNPYARYRGSRQYRGDMDWAALRKLGY